MTTLTFGVSCSSFLSSRALIQLATENKDKYPLAPEIILEDTYVDDLVTGGINPSWVYKAQQELIQLHALGGFDPRKWVSNEPSLLEGLNPENLEVPHIRRDQLTSSFGILGLHWITAEDAISYQVCTTPRPPTKRGMISAISSIFDPCGYIAPVVFLAKTFIQQLWLMKIDWDDPIPPNIQRRWDAFVVDALGGPSASTSRMRTPVAAPPTHRRSNNALGILRRL